MFDFLAAAIVGVHTLSLHVPVRDGQNNVNPGVYLRYNEVQVGIYENTIRRRTFYVGKTFNLGEGFDVMLGAATGYKRKCHNETFVSQPDYNERAHTMTHGGVSYEAPVCSGYSSHSVAPTIALSWAVPVKLFNLAPRITFVPGFLKGRSMVFHLSLEH